MYGETLKSLVTICTIELAVDLSIQPNTLSGPQALEVSTVVRRFETSACAKKLGWADIWTGLEVCSTFSGLRWYRGRDWLKHLEKTHLAQLLCQYLHVSTCKSRLSMVIVELFPVCNFTVSRITWSFFSSAKYFFLLSATSELIPCRLIFLCCCWVPSLTEDLVHLYIRINHSRRMEWIAVRHALPTQLSQKSSQWSTMPQHLSVTCTRTG